MSTVPETIPLRHRHLLGIEGFSPEEITLILDTAESHVEPNRQADKKRALMRGRTIINLFFENSTRTRTSFELAGKRLGADVINMSVSGSSIKKGETLIDTAMTLNAMHPDVLVVRHPESGAVQLLVREGQLRRHQRRRRQPRAPDPGAARRADHPPPQGQARAASSSRSAATSCTAASRAPTSRCSTPWARGSASSRRARCCRRRSTGSASRCSTTCGAASPMSTSS